MKTRVTVRLAIIANRSPRDSSPGTLSASTLDARRAHEDGQTLTASFTSIACAPPGLGRCMTRNSEGIQKVRTNTHLRAAL